MHVAVVGIGQDWSSYWLFIYLDIVLKFNFHASSKKFNRAKKESIDSYVPQLIVNSPFILSVIF